MLGCMSMPPPSIGVWLDLAETRLQSKLSHRLGFRSLASLLSHPHIFWGGEQSQ